uniref:Translation initiation factor eIF2B subunit delta n=1 Tax=Anopheles atroparvus TaxID=41427 RepID=A0AAG5DGG2_ANOAO
MENVASAEAATIKKKRNRSQKKSKSKEVKSAEHPVKPSTGEQAAVVEKENNPPAVVARAPAGEEQQQKANCTPASKEEETDVGPLARNPSRRRKRKPKNTREAKDNATVLESLTVEEVFPVGQPYSQAISQNLSIAPIKQAAGEKRGSSEKKTLVDVSKYTGIVDVDFHQIFPATTNPVIRNISLDEIFPGPEVFSFQESNINFGKLKNPALPAVVAIVTEQQTLRSNLYSELGLLDITSESVFPNDPLVGLKLPSETAGCSSFDLLKQQQDKAANMSARSGEAKSDKTREEILAEREAKKAAKLAAKNKNKEKPAAAQPEQREKAQPAKAHETKASAELSKSGTDGSICEKLKDLHISDETSVRVDKTSSRAAPTTASETKELSKAERKAQFEAKNPTLAKKGPEGAAKPTLSKAERRAIQEAQRAAKAEALQAKKRDPAPAKDGAKKSLPQKSAGSQGKTAPTGATPAVVKKSVVSLGVVGTGGPPRKHIVNLFNHLHRPKFAAGEIVNSPTLHPAVTKLGIQYAEGAVVGSKARCLAMLKMLNQLIHDYESPPEKEFGRSFEETLNTSAAYLQRCRPFSVSMTNALRHVKMYTRQLDGKVSDSEQKEFLLESIESYIRDQIEKAEEAICISVQEKIFDGDVILTYGCSSLIKHILEEANRRSKNFRVIIVNARPREEEHAMLEHLVQQGVKCTCVLINAVSYVMPEVTKVLLGAHALLANGSVMSRVGTAQIALVAKSYNVPVLVCCETHKFTERVQTDAFVYNEIGNPNDLVLAPRTRDLTEAKPMLAGWETLTSLTILNLHYDVTPPELVTAVVTEIAILPCTSVPVILRMKPSDVTY